GGDHVLALVDVLGGVDEVEDQRPRVADFGPDHALDPARHDLGGDGAGAVGDQFHLGGAPGHRGDGADQAVAVDHRVVDRDPVAAADVDRHVGVPDARRAGDHPAGHLVVAGGDGAALLQ